jgi:predicted RNA-binding protein YlxR (DUF448 family)
MKARHIAQRSCVACRTVQDKSHLVRLVRTPEGEIVIDPTGKRNGRGAYLCPRLDCLRVAQKRKSLDRALKTAVPVDSWARLEEAFGQFASEQSAPR